MGFRLGFKNCARGADTGAPSAARDLGCSGSVGVRHELTEVVGEGDNLTRELRGRGPLSGTSAKTSSAEARWRCSVDSVTCRNEVGIVQGAAVILTQMMIRFFYPLRSTLHTRRLFYKRKI